jgi:hypothetical protein
MLPLVVSAIGAGVAKVDSGVFVMVLGIAESEL